jgi:predicted RNA-binding protein with RPS1 domain
MKQLTPHPWDTIGAKYEKSTKVRGKVVSLTDYGAFIEIEKGIEGLIHISEMSWTQHIKHPSQMVSMGQMLDAIVLNIDKDDKKLALGMKQLEPDPWHDLMEKYPINSVHRGIVRNLTNFGVFVELEAGVDGLVHISDLSWTKKIRHPGEFVKKGDQLDVTVLSIDPDQRRIALGHKQIQTNPWDFFEDKYKVSAETNAKIERIIEKGVIVELPDGVDGFVPVSQLSFAPVRNISEYFHFGDILPLRVVEFDKEAKKIVLSCVEYLRHKTQEEIDEYISKHPVPNSEKYIKETPPPLTPEETNFSVDALDDIVHLIPKKEKLFETKTVEPAPLPVVVEAPAPEPVLIVEEIPTPEPVAVVEDAPIMETIEIEIETPEPILTVEEAPIVETIEMEIEIPEIEPVPIVEETPEPTPIVEEAPIMETIEIEIEIPEIEPVQVVEETQEPTPTVEEAPIVETVVEVVEEKPVEETTENKEENTIVEEIPQEIFKSEIQNY